MYFGPPPQQLPTEVFATVPDGMRTGPGGKRAGFLEGPSFDRAGNLLCVDVQAGRVYRISPRGDWDIVVEYDGIPNGLKLHRDGRAFIADRKNGLMVLDAGHGLDRNAALGTRGGPALPRRERPAFRRQRRPVFHRPGAQRAAGSDRLRVSIVGRGQPGLHHRQRAESERPGAEQARDRSLRRGDARQRDMAHRTRRSGAPRRVCSCSFSPPVPTAWRSMTTATSWWRIRPSARSGCSAASASRCTTSSRAPRR